ncbi:MAG: glycoside hydrolase domain-containing protein, partial [Promethearchaeota archaeon]
MFETFNGDDLMYIAGYMIIYHDNLYIALVSLMLATIYLTTIIRMHEFRDKNVSIATTVMTLYRDLIWIAVFTLIILLIGMYVGLGVSCFLMGGILGCGLLLDRSHVFFVEGKVVIRDIKTGSGPNSEVSESQQNVKIFQAGAGNGLNIQAPSRGKNVVVIIMMFLIDLLAGVLTLVDFMWRGDFEGKIGLWFQLLNVRLILSEAIYGLILFILTATLIRAFIGKFILRCLEKKNVELLLNLCTIALLFILIGIMQFEVTFYYIRTATLIIPWIFAMQVFWLASFMLRRRRSSPGLIGSIMIVIAVTSWLGPLVTSNVDLEYLDLLQLVFIVIIASLFSLVQVYVTPVILEKRKLTGTNVSSIKARKDPGMPEKKQRANRSTRQQKAKIGAGFYRAAEKAIVKYKRVLQPALLIASIVVPIAFTIVPATSTSNYQLLANVDGRCIFYLVDPTSRVEKYYLPRFGLSTYQNPNNTIQIHAAKGEYEPIQIVMKPINQKYFSLYDIQFSGFTHLTDGSFIGPENFIPYRVRYVEELNYVVPDVLENFSAFAISDGSNVPLWFTFYIPENATAGDYSGTLSLAVDNCSLEWSRPKTVEINVRLHVFNITLPTIPTLKSCFGIWNPGAISSILPKFKQYRMMRWMSSVPLPTCTLHENGSVKSMNFTRTDATIDEMHGYGSYLVGFQFFPNSWTLANILPSSFTVNGVNYTNSSYLTASTINVTLKDYLNKFHEYYSKNKSYIDDFGRNVSWFQDMYINGHDEIDGAGGEYKQQALREYRWLRDLNCPLPIMQTIGDYHEDTMSLVDIICWHTTGFEKKHITDWKAKGGEVWIYTTRGPRFPTPSLSTSGMAMQIRALGWQCFIYNYSCYLIWDVITPYNARQGHAYQGWSGGSILYKEHGDYVISTRMELVREGFEDHDYFYLLSMQPDSPEKSRLMNEINSLMDGFQPDMDYRAFQRLKIEIGEFLSA